MNNDEDIAPDTLVVDLTEIHAVESVLEDLGISVSHRDKIEAFDLALLTLELGGAPLNDIDPVLAELRARFAGRGAGWSPILGKNRRMASVFGAYPQTKGMSLWDPIAKSEEEPTPSFTGAWGHGIRVGLLDTRIYNHPALAGCDIVTPDPTTRFDKDESTQYTIEDGHGVFTAGLILQQAPGATLVARHVLGSDGKAFAWDVVTKLAEFLEDPVDVLVLASGCRNTLDGRPPLIIERAMERLGATTMIVAAAGNHGIVEGMTSDIHITRTSATWPAALPRVVAVGVAGATYSPELPWVNCVVDIGEKRFVSTYLQDDNVKMLDDASSPDFSGGFASWVGTSCAAAYVGGVVAAKMAELGEKSAYDVFDDLCAGPTVKKYMWTYKK
ncbi:S8/S53 family peptidase [Lentzea sp. NPDC005914]|uniref:S8/S53 family peptidase n=1 Tax=Lentzea sp. NPDC005914 TaxID=3154572 RepID=UPI0033ECF5D5